MKACFKRLGIIGLSALLAATSAVAGEEETNYNNIVGTEVVLRTLDKVTATTEDFAVKVGDHLEYGSLRVEVKHCEKKPPEDIPATWGFIQIFDKRTDGEGTDVEGAKVFSGWMLAERPAISALEHPVYDVWLLECNKRRLR